LSGATPLWIARLGRFRSAQEDSCRCKTRTDYIRL
jgi:hypothetical protein